VLADRSSCERFVTQARLHSVLGLVLASLSRAGSIDGFSGQTESLRDALRTQRRRAMILQAERDRALGIISRAGVPAVVLKGAGLATTVYAEGAEREFGDIDLLVPRDALDHAARALAAADYRHTGSEHAEQGYREHHFHLRMQRDSGALVELHWGLTTAREPFSLDPAPFLSDAIAVDGGMRVPRPEHALLHIVTENARGAFNRLNRVVDVDRIIASAPSLDWNETIVIAESSNLRASLALSVALSRALLGTPVPDAVRERLRPATTTRVHLELLDPAQALIEQRALSRESWGELMRLWLLPGPARRETLVQMLSAASNDPLQWLWDGDDKPARQQRGLARRVAHVARTIGFQLGVYATAGARSASRRSAWQEFW
jgi:hypothetical protein